MKKVKILTITLIIALVTMVAFAGVYVQKQNRMENKVKGYAKNMDLNGARRVTLKVIEEETEAVEEIAEEETSEETTEGEEIVEETSEEATEGEEIVEDTAEENAETEQSEEPESVKATVQDYKNTKKIIEKRLKAIGVQDYLIKLNEETGEMVVELPENEGTDIAVSYLGTTGEFQIKDTETGEVLMDNNDIKLSNVLYGQDTSSTTGVVGTVVYLNIEFTKDGAKKFEDISKTYVTQEENAETDEGTEEQVETDATTETESDETTTETKEKTITMTVDGEEVMSTSFEEPVTTGKLQLSIGRSATDAKTLQQYATQATNIAILLDNGQMPVQYEVIQNQYVLSNITEKQISIMIYVAVAIVAILLIVLIIKYKSQGAVGAISYIGLVSLLLLVIRYTNVSLSIEGVLGIAIVLALNYGFTVKLLSKIEKQPVREAVKETYKEFFLKIVPVCIMAVVFSFVKWASISSLGMVMFWGIALIAIYNFIVTNNFLKIKADK